MCFARVIRLFFCSFFFFFNLFIGTWGSFGCVHGEVRSFIEYGVVL